MSHRDRCLNNNFFLLFMQIDRSEQQQNSAITIVALTEGGKKKLNRQSVDGKDREMQMGRSMTPHTSGHRPLMALSTCENLRVRQARRR